jgi:hypothetical protein
MVLSKCSKVRLTVFTTACSLMVGGATGHAQSATASSGPAVYGTATEGVINLSSHDFVPHFSSVIRWSDGAVIGQTDDSFYGVMAPIHLPTGALITSVTYFYFDNEVFSPTGILQAKDSAGTTTTQILHTFPQWSGGNNLAVFPLATPLQIDNVASTYMIFLTLHRTTSSALSYLIRVRITYRLQVSPAPGFASFSDVPVSHPLHQFVEALVAAGITGGCGGGNYCPDAPITRGQMAVFLAAALGLHWPY